MALLSIGELARRTGVPVRTIRFWSDEGVLAPAGRTGAGDRRYDSRALARLDLVRTLREVGMGLDQIRAVLVRQLTIPEVAAAHVRAIDARMSELRVQRAVCTLLARGEPDERTTILMNDLARLSASERRQMIDDFVDATFADIDPAAPGTEISGRMRAVTLPDDPSTDQLEAWVELAELVADDTFRARVRHMAVAGSGGAPSAPPYDPARVTEHAGDALARGVDPTSTGAQDVLERIGVAGLDTAARARVADEVETFTDGRVDRYWTLVGRLNEWPAHPSSVPAFEWFAAALRAASGP